MLVVTVISVDVYLFGGFSDLSCHLEDMGIGVFWLQCALNWEVATKRLLHEQVKLLG